MARDFNDGVALVIGGSGGVGSAICRRLAASGSSVALTYNRNKDAADEVVAAVSTAGGSASAHQVDLSSLEQVEALFESVESANGAIHSVVHAAGTHIGQPYVSQLEPAEWKRVIDTDVHGFFHVAHAAIPRLRRSKGSIVFISSAGLKRFPTGDILSVAPKGAIEALVHAIAKEEGRHGIRANNVALGVIDAGMFPKLVESGELSQEWVDVATRNTPLRRFGTPDEVAEAVVYLASNRASFITGQTLMLDGGYTL